MPQPVQYDVAYPYGVGGDAVLDMFTVEFDNWVINTLLGYFITRYVQLVMHLAFIFWYSRFITTPFAIPSVTGLLGQAFTAVIG